MACTVCKRGPQQGGFRPAGVERQLERRSKARSEALSTTLFATERKQRERGRIEEQRKRHRGPGTSSGAALAAQSEEEEVSSDGDEFDALSTSGSEPDSDGEGGVVDAKGLDAAGGLEVGERREEELFLLGEGREEGDVGAAQLRARGAERRQKLQP